MNSIQVSKSEQLINDLSDLLKNIGTLLNNNHDSVKKGLVFLSRPEVFNKTLKDFLFEPKYVRTDNDIYEAVKLWCLHP